MPFAVALSQHPVTADAIGEVLGGVLEAGGVEPDLAVAFLSAHHEPFAGELTNAIRTLLRPGTLLGTATSAVIGGAQEAEDGPGLVLWAGWIGDVQPVGLEVHEMDDGIGLLGLDPATIPAGGTLLLLADPSRFPTVGFVEELHRTRPDVAIVGGLAAGPDAALVLDDRLRAHGAVGAILRPDQVIGPVVSQGCRPVGPPMVVTGAQGNVLIELAGEPALDRLEAVARELDPAERSMLRQGIQIGLVIDESKPEFGPGDFLVRSLVGADRRKRVIAAGTPVEVGQTVQFHVRDATSADHELRTMLDGVQGPSALVFTCTGRGVDLFDEPNHDAGLVAELVGTPAVAGMFCAGEIGPVAGRSFVHGFTASVLVLDDSSGRDEAERTRG